jgi:cyclophilin family peptidyl-prolyl cis-trans isomerase/HEAT repeat protein
LQTADWRSIFNTQNGADEMKQLFIISLLVGTVAFAQPLQPEKGREILAAQDARDVTKIELFLHSENPEVRLRAALAAGSIQSPSLIGILDTMTSDKSDNVRTAAAFALGQLWSAVDSVQRSTVTGILLERLKSESSENVSIRIAEALGKCGDARGLDEMVRVAGSLTSESVKDECALSIGRLAYRKIESDAATAFATVRLQAGSTAGKWKAAYAFFRTNNKSVLQKHKTVLQRALKEKDPRVRMFVATALGRILDSESDVKVLAGFALNDPDWRVRVNAVKALSSAGKNVRRHSVLAVQRALGDKNEHVVLTALAAATTMDSLDRSIRDPLVRSLHGIANQEKKSQVSRLHEMRRLAILALLRLEDSKNPVTESPWMKDEVGREAIAEALSDQKSNESLEHLLVLVKDPAHLVRRKAYESLYEVAKVLKLEATELSEVKSAFVNGLAPYDLPTLATITAALSDSLFADSASVPPLLESLHSFEREDRYDGMTAVIQCLSALKSHKAEGDLHGLLTHSNPLVRLEAGKAIHEITGRAVVSLVEPKKEPDWEAIAFARVNPLVEVKTEKGTFTLQLLPDEAPLTCASFASLIKRGFFDGLVFHRVVPNFVVQGGDPDGSGWGGPGFTIRSEFGYEHYERGMVGVASSGKDSEGSQFFVTHSEQPHLDGRYTIFARLTKGMEVVDKLQIGDKIVKMSFAVTAAPVSKE